MELRPLGRTGLNVSVCCLGTMTFGEQNSEAEGHAQLDLARQAGVNFIDSAELYPIPPRPETAGRTEEIIGSWLAGRGRRDDVVITSKVVGRAPGMTWFRADGSGARVTARQIDEAVAGSLRRLRTDYIDLYFIHWPDRAVAAFGARGNRDYDGDYETFEAQLEALNRHVEAGAIRHIGVSNETAWGVTRFLDIAEKRGWPRIAAIQNAYNLVNRTFEGGLAEIALREDVGLLAYSPLAQGNLTGKYRGGALPAGSRKALFQRMQRYEGPGAEPAINDFVDLARDRGVDPAHLAIKFCATRPFLTSVIIGATTMDQLKTDLAAFDITWPDALEAEVNALNARHRSPCP